MNDKEWMYQNLKDDIALELLLFTMGKIGDINIEKAQKLSKILNLKIDFNDNINLKKSVQSLLDKYSFAATEYILEKLKLYSLGNNKKLMIVLFDPYRVTNSLILNGSRYDDEIVDYLKKGNFNYFDMNLVHVDDYKNFNISIQDYYKKYLIGHYNPTGNHFFAYSIKDKIVEWLYPKPITYKRTNQKWVDFKDYLHSVN
jgi:hypothetical protein